MATLALALVGLLTMAGCGSAPPAIDSARAAAFQQEVLAITQDVAAGQYDAAASGVQTLRTALQAAVDDGSVSAARSRVIGGALDKVTTQIVAAVQQRAAEAAAAQKAAADAAAQQAAAQAAATRPATSSSGPSSTQSTGGKGKGNGKGKGKG